MSPADNDQSEAELLKALLAERDLPCPVCGYNLRAISSTNCPECGAKLDLRVGSTDLKLGPWLAALLVIGLPLGFLAGAAVLGLAVGIVEDNLEDLMFAGGLLIPVIFMAGMLAMLIRRRRSIWRWSPLRQVLLALLMLITSVVITVVVLGVIGMML
ncbi:MAG: hypothetical protein O6758_04970 [Planctomycetota bacterium]|nr:hypothetical protein [Planctomycetota bacterium]